MSNIYPKATVVNVGLIKMVEARADRWMKRYYKATARIDELEKELKGLRNGQN